MANNAEVFLKAVQALEDVYKRQAILCIAMFLSGIYCLLGVLLKKYQKTDHVALAPFVLAAEVVLLYLK